MGACSLPFQMTRILIIAAKLTIMTRNTQLHLNSKTSNQINDHILVISSPFQGHVAPLLKLCHHMITSGAEVMFLTMDYIRAGMISSSSKGWNDKIRIISVADGLECEDDKKDQKKLHYSAKKVLPGYLEDLLNDTNHSTSISDRITGVIIDSSLGFLFEIPKKMGIKCAAFWCSTPGCLALGLMIPQLIEDKFIDANGMPLKDESIQLLPNMPPMSKKEFTWYFPSDINMQKEIFHVTKGIMHHLKNVDWIICNWFNDLEPSATILIPNLLPVGPLLANGHSAGSFCPEDSTCLEWLDEQPQTSVLYVAFGSTTRFSKEQLDGLAGGLEQTGRPFLWVAWSGLSDGTFHPYLTEFRKRVGVRGKIVEWAPQEVVLGHPSIACFVTHCGWSSFLESLSMGVPFLCWPYFGDQLYTQSCICEGWRVGLILEGDGSGVVQSSEIVKKVDRLLCDEVIKENSQKWKEMAVKSINEGGSSLVNLRHALEHLKG